MIRKLATVLRWPARDQKLVLRTLGWYALLRVLLWVVPYRRLRGLLRAATAQATRQGRAASEDRRDPAHICTLVARVGYYVPGETCLLRALVAQQLLRRQGCPAIVAAGARSDGAGGLEAHAWIETPETTFFRISSYHCFTLRDTDLP